MKRNMKGNMTRETKMAMLFFTLFNILNYISIEIGSEVPVLHFFLGLLAALAFTQIVMGLLPESIYSKIKSYKKN